MEKLYVIEHGIRLPDGALRRDGTVRLDDSHEDTKTFLRRGAIRPADGEHAYDGDDLPAAPNLSVPEGAGRDALVANGYDTDAKVGAASDDTLLAINGIGAKALGRIRAHLGG